jgi:hypothetical protein
VAVVFMVQLTAAQVVQVVVLHQTAQQIEQVAQELLDKEMLVEIQQRLVLVPAAVVQVRPVVMLQQMLQVMVATVQILIQLGQVQLEQE